MLRIGKLKSEGCVIFKWQYEGVRLLARTKSEARAAFKKHFQFDRLPVGAIVELVKGYNSGV